RRERTQHRGASDLSVGPIAWARQRCSCRPPRAIESAAARHDIGAGEGTRIRVRLHRHELHASTEAGWRAVTIALAAAGRLVRCAMLSEREGYYRPPRVFTEAALKLKQQTPSISSGTLSASAW